MREWKRVLFAAISSAGLFLLLFLALKWHPLVALALSAGLYGGVYLLLAPKVKEQTLRMTYGVDEEEYQAVLAEARKDLAVLAQAEETMDSPQDREQVRRLWTTGSSLVSYLEKEPGMLPQARQFFLYYLDTAAHLMERYQAFQKAGVRSPEVVDLLQRTEQALPLLNQAFEKQYDQLLAGELMDTQVEIDVLKAALGPELLPKEGTKWWPWGPWAMCGSPSPPR